MSRNVLPSSAEDIRQLTDHEENDGAQYDVCKRNPENIGRWTNVLVDLGQNGRNETVTCTIVNRCHQISLSKTRI
jgi:hypothetical protein